MLLWEADELSHSQLQILFLLTVYSFFIFSYKEHNQFDFGIDHLAMSICKVVSLVVDKDGEAVYSQQKQDLDLFVA